MKFLISQAFRSHFSAPQMNTHPSASPWAKAMLDVLHRRGRCYGLLAVYEESRLDSSR